MSLAWLIDFQRRTLSRAQSAEAAQTVIARENARLLDQAHAAREQLTASNKELQLAVRDLETFAWSVSHDLQEPLRMVAIYAELLETDIGGSIDADQQKYLAQVISGAERMGRLIGDIRIYTSAAKGEDSEPPLADSETVLAGVLEVLAPDIRTANATVTFDNLPAVPIHESRLAQVFQNLLANALKYRAARDLRIHLSAAAEGSRWIFSVADNGIGIEAQYAEQIFGLFTRLHPNSDYPGSGIGLAVCRRVIEQYGGWVWL